MRIKNAQALNSYLNDDEPFLKVKLRYFELVNFDYEAALFLSYLDFRFRSVNKGLQIQAEKDEVPFNPVIKIFQMDKQIQKVLGFKQHTMRKVKKTLKETVPFVKITVEKQNKDLKTKTYYEIIPMEHEKWKMGKLAHSGILKNNIPNHSGILKNNIPLPTGWNIENQCRNKNNIIKKNFVPNKLGDDVCVGKEKIPNFERYIKYANQLSQIVQKHKNIKTNPSNWAKWFCKIKDTNGKIPVPRIKAALDWYAIHAYEPYVPVIESGESFHRKFIQLENAMKRSSKPIQYQNQSQPNELSEERKELLLKRFGNYIPKFKELGIDTSNIMDIFQALRCWWEETKDFWAKCKADYKEFQKPLPDGTCMGGGRVGHRSFIATAVTDEQIFSDLYLHWVMDELKEWKNWSGSFIQFLPGGKSWKKFCFQVVRHREWRLDAELRKVIKCGEL